MSLIVRTLSEQIFAIVRERIISGALPRDHPIRQDALATELGVSKIPLREALARLEQEGLLTSQANRGFFVRPMSATEAEEIYELRLALEPEAAARACLPRSLGLARSPAFFVSTYSITKKSFACLLVCIAPQAIARPSDKNTNLPRIGV